MVEWIEILLARYPASARFVSTLVVEWIEIRLLVFRPFSAIVSTLVVEWIEIVNGKIMFHIVMSPPSWWSGLKWSDGPTL